MKIDKKKLIELLVEKTGMQKKEIESQMDLLTDRILDAAGRGKALEIKEFGLFYFDQNNELKFEASEELSTEISFKYAGMKPVELKPERNTGIPSEIDDFEPSESDNDISVLDKSEKKQEDFSYTKPAEKKSDPKPKTPKTYKKPVTRKKDNSLVWGILAFLLVLIIGGLYYFMQTDKTDLAETTQQPVPEQQLSPTDPLTDVAEPDPAGLDGEGEGDGLPATDPDIEPEQEQTEPNEVLISEGQDQSPFGLNGVWDETINDLYSIVVHSFYNEDRANEVATDFENNGYRAAVSARIVNELEVWRVSIGQFPTIEEAQNSASTLPEPYNNQNFIQRIQQ